MGEVLTATEEGWVHFYDVGLQQFKALKKRFAETEIVNFGETDPREMKEMEAMLDE